MMKRYISYIKNISVHKWHVFIECCSLGIPVLGLLHDWSKFLPSEMIKYAHTFYNPDGTRKKVDDSLYMSLGTALTHHFRCNKHHWQYYLLVQGVDSITALDIPLKYRKEMLADWIGAGKTYGGSVSDWYRKNKDKIIVHDDVRVWLGERIG